MGPAVAPHLSLSATKMTLRSSNSEANTLITCRTLRHLNRLSKSTCSSLESLGRRSSITYKKTTTTTTRDKRNWLKIKVIKIRCDLSAKRWLEFSCCSCIISDLISCTGQEGLDFDDLPWRREGRLHQTPHEGVDQGC